MHDNVEINSIINNRKAWIIRLGKITYKITGLLNNNNKLNYRLPKINNRIFYSIFIEFLHDNVEINSIINNRKVWIIRLGKITYKITGLLNNNN